MRYLRNVLIIALAVLFFSSMSAWGDSPRERRFEAVVCLSLNAARAAVELFRHSDVPTINMLHAFTPAARNKHCRSLVVYAEPVELISSASVARNHKVTLVQIIRAKQTKNGEEKELFAVVGRPLLGWAI